jgi:hypothetical protein
MKISKLRFCFANIIGGLSASGKGPYPSSNYTIVSPTCKVTIVAIINTSLRYKLR